VAFLNPETLRCSEDVKPVAQFLIAITPIARDQRERAASYALTTAIALPA
jgi:hypothetical protein